MVGKTGDREKQRIVAHDDKKFPQSLVMSRPFVNRGYAISVAERLKQSLADKRIPARQILVFGSAAHGKAHQWSDIDIAIVCDPFLPSRMEEMHACSREARAIDMRVEIVCFRPDDLNNKYSTIVQEVKRHGISV